MSAPTWTAYRSQDRLIHNFKVINQSPLPCRPQTHSLPCNLASEITSPTHSTRPHNDVASTPLPTLFHLPIKEIPHKISFPNGEASKQTLQASKQEKEMNTNRDLRTFHKKLQTRTRNPKINQWKGGGQNSTWNRKGRRADGPHDLISATTHQR